MTPHTSLTSKSMLLLTLLAVLAIVNAGLIIHGVQSRAQVNELSAKLVAVEESIDTKTTASQQELLQAIKKAEDALNASIKKFQDSTDGRIQSLEANQDYRAIAQDSLHSVVQILSDGRQKGTGFAVSNGLIITNNHVISDAQKIILLTSDGRSAPADIIARYPDDDLALLRTSLDLPPLSFETNYRTGERIITIGNPDGLGLSVTEGLISNAVTHDAGKDYLQISAEINHGSSGGPVINSDGNVVGIVRKRLFDLDGISYAIPALRAKSIIDSTASSPS